MFSCIQIELVASIYHQIYLSLINRCHQFNLNALNHKIMWTYPYFWPCCQVLPKDFNSNGLWVSSWWSCLRTGEFQVARQVHGQDGATVWGGLVVRTTSFLELVMFNSVFWCWSSWISLYPNELLMETYQFSPWCFRNIRKPSYPRKPPLKRRT